MTFDAKMTALADKIRSLTGQTGKLSLDAMDTKLEVANEDKENMITALEELGITIDANASLSDIANMLPNVEAGTDTSDATAEAGDILKGETAYVDGEKITGTMTNNGTISKTMDGINTKSVAVPAGYTSGGTVSLTNDIDNEVNDQANLIDQIKNVVNSLPEAVEPANPKLQNKTVTPTTSKQTITADNGYDGLDTVTVNAIPSSYIQPSGTKTVTTNGTHDVKTYASVNVNVAGEDVTAETNANTEKIAQLTTAVTALETELAGKASGGGGNQSCTVRFVADDNVYYQFESVIVYDNYASVNTDSPMGNCEINALCNSRIIFYYISNEETGESVENVTVTSNDGTSYLEFPIIYVGTSDTTIAIG